MRYMRWSYEELMACPAGYLRVINDEAGRENSAMRDRASAARR